MKSLKIEEIANRIDKRLKEEYDGLEVVYKDVNIFINREIIICFDYELDVLNILFDLSLSALVGASFAKIVLEEFGEELEIKFVDEFVIEEGKIYYDKEALEIYNNR